MADQIATEEDFLLALDDIEKQADKLTLTVVRYLFGALILQSELDEVEHLREYYCLLKKSQEHYCTAVSLTVYVLNVGSHEYLQQLWDYEKAVTLYETDVSLPRFVLRELLSNIAKELTIDEVSGLVSRFSNLQLHKVTDKIQDEFSRMLQVLTLAEQTELVRPEQKEGPHLTIS